MPALGHTLLAPLQGDATRHLFFLHGILGTRANLRGIARRVIDARPGYGAVLVDLRAHGDSREIGGPDTVEQAADDILVLARTLGVRVDGIVGHSFGGKVAMSLAMRAEEVGELWVLDASPGLRDPSEGLGDTLAVVAMLEGAPPRFADRAAFIAYVTGQGFSVAVAQWLAMNLVRADDGEGRVFPIDLARVRRLLESYAELDLFGDLDPPRCPSGFLLGGRSRAVPEGPRNRLLALASRHPYLHVEVLEGAGHWVHVEATEAVVASLSRGLLPKK